MPRHYKNNSDDGLPDQKNKDPLDPNPTAKSPISDGSDDKGQKAFDPRLSSLAELPNVVLPTTSGSDGGDDQLKAEDEEQDQAAVVAAARKVTEQQVPTTRKVTQQQVMTARKVLARGNRRI